MNRPNYGMFDFLKLFREVIEGIPMNQILSLKKKEFCKKFEFKSEQSHANLVKFAHARLSLNNIVKISIHLNFIALSP